MNIQEVSDILSCLRALRAPRHVFITDEPVHDDKGGHYRGLQPKRRGDTIFLANAADVSTPIHEAWHAMTGLAELSAYPVGNILARKYNFLKKFPNIKKILGKRVKYRRATKAETKKEFPDATKYGTRVRHYILTSK